MSLPGQRTVSRFWHPATSYLNPKNNRSQGERRSETRIRMRELEATGGFAA
jgi:hypothetical protein